MSDMACGDPPNEYIRFPMEIDHENQELLRAKVQLQEMQLNELEERHFRDTNPAVKDAWEQYQTVLRLAKNG